VAAYEWLRPRGIDDDVAFTAGPAVGAAFGVLLAVLARRSRWPQVILMAVGTVAAVPCAKYTWLIYNRPRPLGWDALALLFYGVCLAAAVCLVVAGTAGLLLNRRRGGNAC
jgi:ribose/xylose/arabinose/galactoside ABC-type transport system permease subunit